LSRANALLTSGTAAQFQLLCSTKRAVASSRPVIRTDRYGGLEHGSPKATGFSRQRPCGSPPYRSCSLDEGPRLKYSTTILAHGRLGRKDSRELAIGRIFSRHKLVFGRSTSGPDHDAVIRIGGKAPKGGPILTVGMSATSCCGSTPPRIVSQQSSLTPPRVAKARRCFSLPEGRSACRAQDDALQ
jgi:hypothetical protein